MKITILEILSLWLLSCCGTSGENVQILPNHVPKETVTSEIGTEKEVGAQELPSQDKENDRSQRTESAIDTNDVEAVTPVQPKPTKWKMAPIEEEKYRTGIDGGGIKKDNCKYKKISEKKLSTSQLTLLCTKGDVNCQEYYFEGVAYWGTYRIHPTSLYLNYTQKPSPVVDKWPEFGRDISRDTNPFSFAYPGYDTNLFRDRPGYKVRFKRSLYKYEVFRKFPREGCIVADAGIIFGSEDDIEVIYDPQNLLKPYLRLYSEEVAKKEDGKEKNDPVKELGLKSIRLVDATKEKILEMEGKVIPPPSPEP